MEKVDVFLNKDEYISYNQYKAYCEKNNVKMDENLLDERNNNAHIYEKIK